MKSREFRLDIKTEITKIIIVIAFAVIYIHASAIDVMAGYNGNYGEQLTGESRNIYEALVEYYAMESNDSSMSYTLTDVIYFEAVVTNNILVKNDAYEEAADNLKSQVYSATKAFEYDYPECFWIYSFSYTYTIAYSTDATSSTGYKAKIQNITIKITQHYNGEYELKDTYDAGVTKAVNTITKRLNGNDTPYNIVLEIHDYLIEKCYYSKGSLKNCSSSNVFAGDGGVLCQGYSKAFKVLCDQFNIPCAIIAGQGMYNSDRETESHMWNYIQMEDSKWYGVDITWDDKNPIAYNYFIAYRKTMGTYFYFKVCHIENNSLDYPNLSKTAYDTSDISVILNKVDKARTGYKWTDKLVLKWKKQDRVTGYKIYVYNSSKKRYVLCKKITGADINSTVIGNLKAGKTYKFKIRSYKTIGTNTYYGKFSKILRTTTRPARCVINHISFTKSKISISWKKVYRCKGYQIQVSSNKNFSKNIRTLYVYNKNRTSKKISNINEGKVYYVRIRAYKVLNGVEYYGKWSRIKNITTIEQKG